MSGKRPYLLLKRGSYWYVRFAGEKTFHTTGERRRADAERAAMEALARPAGPVGDPEETVAAFAAPYYRWPSCPHAARLLAEGKQIGRQHVLEQRRLLERLVLKDRIARLPVRGLRRADVLDFRARLVAAGVGTRTVNLAIAALKTILQEGVYREELERNSALRIGELKYPVAARGTFTVDELQKLFPADPPGPWKSLRAWSLFLLAAATGMRRGELLALRWRAVDLGGSVVRIEAAWKGGGEEGLPKWGRKRAAVLPAAAVRALELLLDESVRTGPDDYVFADDAGEVPGGTWWQKHFTEAMKTAKIAARARNLTPHSFRHTLNTMLLDSGMDPAKVRAALGWTSVGVQDGYTHWDSDHLRGLAEAFDRIVP